MLFCAATMARPCRAPSSLSVELFMTTIKQTTGCAFRASSVTVRRAGNCCSRTMRFIFKRARAALVKHFQLSSKRRALHKSLMGLMNYKQMPINYGHPFGVLPDASRSSYASAATQQSNKQRTKRSRSRGPCGHGEDPWPAHMPPPHGDDGAR